MFFKLPLTTSTEQDEGDDKQHEGDARYDAITVFWKILHRVTSSDHKYENLQTHAKLTYTHTHTQSI